MGEGLRIDAQTASALARLTDNEKECLRRRLRQQTAKEMALELGVSPHAVEKRLKMARTKLGLSSSLQGARLLAAFEGYQQTGPQAPDLEVEPTARYKRRTTLFAAGGVAMTLLVAALIVLAIQTSPSEGGAASAANGAAQGSAQGGATAPDQADGPPRPNLRKASWDETAAFLSEGFDGFDTDRSGFLEPVEASALEPRNSYRDPSLPAAPPAGERDPAAEAKWTAKLDNDRDDVVSRHEYVEYMIPWLLYQGIPAEWKPRAGAPG